MVLNKDDRWDPDDESENFFEWGWRQSIAIYKDMENLANSLFLNWKHMKDLTIGKFA